MKNCILEVQFKNDFDPELTIYKEVSLDHELLKKAMVRTLRTLIEENVEPLAYTTKIIVLFIHYCDYYKLKGAKYLNDKQSRLKPVIDVQLLDLLNAYEIGVKMDWPDGIRKSDTVIAVSCLASRYLSNKEIDEVGVSLMNRMKRRMKEIK